MLIQILLLVFFRFMPASAGWGWKSSSATNGPETVQQTQARLLSTLLNGYDSQFAPDSPSVYVTLGMNHFDVDVNKNLFLADSFIDQTWIDNRLVWDPSQFGGISLLKIPSKNIWTPDLALYNSPNILLDDRICGNTNVIIYNNGSSLLNARPCQLSAFCDLNLSGPTDTTPQTCPINMGGWLLDKSDQDLNFGALQWDLTLFFDTSDWKLIKVGGTRSVISAVCCPRPTDFAVLNYTITFQRKPPKETALPKISPFSSFPDPKNYFY